ncbi:MAG TPA: HPF/RaiA family ribosome-associated protein [Caulobacterales bacterium]|nr:HPF/RaiA family ribosome-associated protein [Caulobacterales bacterium]
MQTPVQISFEHLAPSDFIEQKIRSEVDALERRYGRITSCRVVVEGRSHRQHQGGLYAVRVWLTLPGGKHVEATRNPPQDHAHEDAYVAIRDVFDALKRQLQEAVAARRDEARELPTQPHGLVAKLFPDDGYGFIRADDGREIYFHQNSVLTDFKALRVGAEVDFDEEEGDQGPQASSVRAYGVSARS